MLIVKLKLYSSRKKEYLSINKKWLSTFVFDVYWKKGIKIVRTVAVCPTMIVA